MKTDDRSEPAPLPSRCGTTISVVMPVHDNAREIGRALAALDASKSHVSEIIVVDDGSTDGSGDVARRFGVRVERLPECAGAAAARNHGARCASGDVLFFLDADVVAPQTTIARAATLLDELPAYAAAFGSYDDEPDAPTTVSRFRNLLHHYTHQVGNREATTFWAGCGVVRKAAFDAVGGFDGAWAGIEDIEIGYRLRARGYRIRLEPSLHVKHLKRWTLASMVRTDLLHRARQWSRLILSHGALPDDLNVRTAQRVSVAVSMLAFAMLPLALVDARWLAAPAAAGALIAGINRDFYALLVRRGGVAFALASLPLHMLYFVCAGLGFSWALVESRVLR